MSTVRVNLLPREVAQERKGRRNVVVTVFLLVLFAGLLGGLYVLKQGDLRRAEQARDDARLQVAALQGELDRLAEFGLLADRLENRNSMLQTAMGGQIAWARLLNDLSLTFPGSSSLLTLTGSATDLTQVAQPGSVDAGTALADVTFTGYSVERFAPGVETVLLEIDDVRALFNASLAVAAAEDRGTTEVTNFSGAVQLDEDALTKRYDAGLPPEVTP